MITPNPVYISLSSTKSCHKIILCCMTIYKELMYLSTACQCANYDVRLTRLLILLACLRSILRMIPFSIPSSSFNGDRRDLMMTLQLQFLLRQTAIILLALGYVLHSCFSGAYGFAIPPRDYCSSSRENYLYCKSTAAKIICIANQHQNHIVSG